MRKLFTSAAVAAALALAAPAVAQELAYTPGGYTTVQGIYIEDGQLQNYMDYVSSTYRRNMDFARQRGWITSYRIYANVNKRDHEPDLYLVTESPRIPTPQEELERQRAAEQFMSSTARQMAEASGQRVRMRRLGGSMLLQELLLRPAR